tara:strand:- start:588 stop:1313 length:726 start_codon:yes stop_codon:yes gene_type:complete
MKGIVLAGGLGTRLHPLTKVTNKCLLPVYDKPMIHYPIQSLVDSGIDEVMVVVGGNAAGEFLRILGNGSEFGLKHLHYSYQAEANGIADALGLAEDWVDGEPMCVILADNILQKPFTEAVSKFDTRPDGAVVFLTDVEHPEWYGVATLNKAGEVTAIEEKPKNPTSNSIVVGVYIYDETVWDYIRQLSPSERGELEITDVNNHYLSAGKLRAEYLKGWWKDAGESIDTYMETNARVWADSR